ncbi:hypothetical protein ACFU99_28800 [Streptomyces sp. NPDC057654]|uniref:hypothetical protein n=1 Tax=Streptomyces sp. NPDC057654 TaxID=3346196 RepID=UPI0036873F26
MRYQEAEAEAARAARRGQGHRSDLAARTLPALSLEEFLRLAEDATIPVAHRTLWALLWEGEIRLRNALSLDVRDVSPDRHYPRVETGERTISLSDQTAALARASIGGRDEGPFLTSERGAALSREAAVRFARRAGPGVHAFRAGGRIARKVRPPRVKIQTLLLGAEAEDVPDACHCRCGHIHPWRPDVCGRTANAALLVDVTIESPMSGELKDRRLRPFCQGCYDAVVGQTDAKKKRERGF